MLTRRMQIQLVRDRLTGLTPAKSFRARDFQEPWRSCWVALQAMGPDDRPDTVLIKALAKQPEKDRTGIVAEILAAVPGDNLLPVFQSLAEIAADLPPIEWLWRGWIPRGMLSLLGAVPGAGKSLTTLDLARRVIHGLGWPDGSVIENPGSTVVYVDAENVPMIHNARAERWEMDRSRLFMLLPETNSLMDFSNQRDRDRLVELLHGVAPELVIIDSLSSISSKGENNVDDVREVLGWLTEVAQFFRVGMVLIHHLRKRGPLPLVAGVTIDDFRGSGHIIAMARSVMGLSTIKTEPDSKAPAPRRFEVIKTNLCQYPDALGVELLPLHPEGVLLKWGKPARPYDESGVSSKRETCEEWLVSLLADGPIPAAEVLEIAGSVGFSESTVFRARRNLTDKVMDTHGKRHRDNMWQLNDFVEGHYTDEE